jgi:hypothetical protein
MQFSVNSDFDLQYGGQIPPALGSFDVKHGHLVVGIPISCDVFDGH